MTLADVEATADGSSYTSLFTAHVLQSDTSSNQDLTWILADGAATLMAGVAAAIALHAF